MVGQERELTPVDGTSFESNHRAIVSKWRKLEEHMCTHLDVPA